MPNNLSGQFDLFAATEGTTLPNSTDVASFTDGNTNDAAANFTATIDWGDGITTTGTVVGGNGSFTVLGGHTYADEGFPNGVVTVTRISDNAQLVLQGGVSVADADNLNVNGQPTIVGNPNQALNNVVVATFTDTYANLPSDLTAPIDWGDGTTTMGTVAGSGGSYSIIGSHTYATNGSFTITTFVNDDAPDAASDGAQTQAVIGFGGNVVLNAATETIAVPAGTEVATFGDSNTGDTTADFTASIDWGDGVTTAGTVSGSNGSFTVASASDHTYADEGNFTEVVTITRTTDNATTAPSGTVMVAEADSLTAAGTTVSGDPGVAINNATVATFSDSNHQAIAGDFVATIDWGDGSSSTGTVSGSSGAFTVAGSHTYAQDGQDTIVVSVSEEPDNPQATAFTDAQSRALIGLAPVSGSSITIAEGTAVAAGTQVATFSDSNLSDTAASFTASIDWGDGTSSAGTVAGSNGSFTVTSSGSHSYTGDFGDEGQNTVTTTLTRTDNTTATAVGAVNLTESDSLTLTADSISANAGQALNDVQVATFSDTFTGNTASGFTATIEWGDGTSTLGTISGSGGAYTVDGSHTYTTGGNDTLTVTVADNEPGTATATGTASASINLGGQMVFTSATEGTAVPATTPIATFSDSTLTDTANSFTASIDWGDGVTTAGSVVGGAGSFTVEGGHTYTDEGSNVVAATITRTADQSSSTTTGPVTVAEGDSFAGQGTTITANLDQTFSGTVATFTDTDTVTSASDLAATVNWGDGTTTNGTVSGSNGSFTVSGSHAYTATGQDTITVSLLDDTPGTATGTATSTATVTALSGQMVLTSATEDTALPNSTPVATFSDSSGTDTASSFTATIDWGDGVTTAGTVVGSGGSFTVEGGHTYADEGSDPATVTLTRTADQLQTTATGNIAVAEGDSLTPQGTSFTVDVNQAFSGTVATFTDTDTANPASDFAATVDWGDGTTTTGTVSGSNGAFTVDGSHTYTAGGQDTVQVTLADDAPGTATATATTTATVRSLAGQMVLNAATEGTALPNSTPVATFTDTASSDAAGDFTATIDWGDGVTTAGTVVGSAGSFTVEGGHTYADEGSDPASVTLTHTADNLQATASGTVAAAEGDSFTPHGTSISVDVNQAFSGTVATFSDIDTANAASDFAATVDWGDGTTTTGTVSGSNGAFTVSGSHTYTAGGQDTVKVTLTDDAPGTATATATTTATVRSLSGHMVLNAATEGTALPNSTAVATFTDTNGSDAAGSFAATINWGDGVTTAGTVVGSAGSFTVEGGHTYADEGSDPASVTLTHTGDNLQATASGSVSVAEGDSFTPHGMTFTAAANHAFSGAVATFSDTDTVNVASDFTATINWGDGTTTTGTVVGSNGGFTVDGSHTYATTGQFTVTVKGADDSPGTATFTTTSTAKVGFPGQMVLNAATEDTKLPNNTAVATFTDSTPGDNAGSFTATINWGDGVTTAGTVVGSHGTFTVEGGHTYADEGNDAASVSLTRKSDHLQSTASGQIAVAEDDVFTPHGTIGLALPTFSGTIATFSDTDHANGAGDFAASINWGDGTTTTGTVSGSNGSFSVNGSHTYAQTAVETVKVTLTDDAPGTATATATSFIIAADPPSQASIAKADLLFRNAIAGTVDLGALASSGPSLSSTSSGLSHAGLTGADSTLAHPPIGAHWGP